MWTLCRGRKLRSIRKVRGVTSRISVQTMRKIISKYLLGSLRTIALGGMAVYLGYHLIQGENGAISYLLISKELQDTTEILAFKTEKRKKLEHQVSLLRPDTIDLDMLVERSRIVLNYGRNDELVVFYE